MSVDLLDMGIDQDACHGSVTPWLVAAALLLAGKGAARCFFPARVPRE
nr:hypothetical protein [Candidatus Sigynarchaeum springense]MDO8115597.1 hypothetical protein [Candidatus Sigynarchaeota archaeon]